MAVALELNDAGITAVRSDAPDTLAIAESPGYAVIDDDAVVTGSEARRRARLRPRLTHTRFWDALDTEPLGKPFPAHLSRADLAHAHLNLVWQTIGDSSKTMLAVPGWYSLEQLGLILGMARACDIAVSGMIDSALAAAASVAEGRALIHVDLHLHRTVATRILRSEQLVREDTVMDDAVGFVPLYDMWARRIAQSFVRQTRFDPLHTAETEQVLYDHLPHWLDALGDGEEASFTLESGPESHTAEIAKRAIVSSASRHYDVVAALARSLAPAGEPLTLLVSHRLAVLPGLVDALARDVTERLLVLPAEAVATGALLYERHAEPEPASDGALTLLTRLSVVVDPESPAEAVPARNRGEDERAPTHLLYDGVAHALDGEPFLLGVSIPVGSRGINLLGATAGISRHHCSVFRDERDGTRILVEDHSKFGTFVNGRRVHERTALAPGDRLRLGTPGLEVELIEVLG